MNDRGARLDPQIHAMLQLLARSGRPTLDQLGPERARQEMDRLSLVADIPETPVAKVEDGSFSVADAEIPFRVYTPFGGGERPATVYFHGGGFVIGSIVSHDRFCRLLTARAGATVISVDYRLAPEHPFPTAVDDAAAAFEWVHANAASLGVDPARIAVAGDSAGGNLAAVVAQEMRRRGGPMPAFQLLIYPGTDMNRTFDSHRTLGGDYFLTTSMIDWFLANYLTAVEQQRDPRASPIVTAELAGLPPAHVATAGFDPLRDEGDAYADALRAAGAPTTSRCYDSLIHGFISMGGIIDAAAHAANDLGDALHAGLRR